MEKINITILAKEYKVSCHPEQQAELQRAVSYLEEKITEIQQHGKISSFEGILVNAAINLAYEVMQQNFKNCRESQTLIDHLAVISNKLDLALTKKSKIHKPVLSTIT